MSRKKSGASIDPIGKSQIQLFVVNRFTGNYVLTIIPKRQARAFANRILHEIEYAEGKRVRRPSTPHLDWDEGLRSPDD